MFRKMMHDPAHGGLTPKTPVCADGAAGLRTRASLYLMVGAAIVGILAGVADAQAQEFRPLFDGTTMKGWKTTGGGTWVVKDSALHGTLAGGAEGYLCSEMAAKDFTLRLKFWHVKGNSGVNFRNQLQGTLAKGIQADIDGANTSGHLYDNVKAKYVAQGGNIRTWYKPNAWNDLEIDADSTTIQVKLNGNRTVEYEDLGGRRQGIFAFQLHGGQDMDVRFKDIEYRDHDAPTTSLAPALKPRPETKSIPLGLVGNVTGIWKINGVMLPRGRKEP